MDKIKILYILSSLNAGGVERLIFNYIRYMDMTAFSIDIAINDTNKGMLEEYLTSYGCNIFRFTKFRVNYRQANKDLRRIIDENHYDIIHSHMGNRTYSIMKYAKKRNIKVRISHNHLAYMPESFFSKVIRKVTALLAETYSSNLMACGIDSGRWMWGNKKFDVMTNAIELDLHSFDTMQREKVRNEFVIQKRHLIVNIGRLYYQKNQLRLVEIFKEYLQLDKDAVLMLVGSGEDEEIICNKIHELKLEDKVILTGSRKDVQAILSAADLFILPSLFEGLPVSLIEAQCSGLRCIISDSITEEGSSKDLVSRISLQKSNKEWSSLIFDEVSKGFDRRQGKQIVLDMGYNIEDASKKLMKYYKDELKK